MSKELSNGELVEKIREQLNKSKAIEITTEEENELDTMKRILMGEIRNQRYPHKIKRHFQLYFGIPQESPEKLQLDQLMFKQDKSYEDLEDKLKAYRVETKSEMRIIKWALIGLGAVFTGAASLPEVIRLFGLG